MKQPSVKLGQVCAERSSYPNCGLCNNSRGLEEHVPAKDRFNQFWEVAGENEIDPSY